jgi:hypothetical protein
MYENPEIMRQIVNGRIAEGRSRAADRRLAGSARRRAGRRIGWISRFTASPRPERAPARKPAAA